MKILKLTFLLAFVFCFQFCKKSEPGKPMPYTSEVYTPPGYNSDVYHSKTVLVTTPYSLIRDIIIDSANRSNAYLIGNFGYIGSITARGIVRFSSTTNSFSSYPVNVYGTADFSSFYQSSTGYHYLGGAFQNNATSAYGTLAVKNISGSLITNIVGVDDRVNVMKEIGSNFYIAGDFSYLNSISCTPLLQINTNPVTQLGSLIGIARITRIVNYNSTIWLSSNSTSAIQGNVMTLSGSNWNMLAGNGFNYYVLDMDVFNNTLYACGQMTGDRYSSYPLNYVNQFDGTSWIKTGTNNLPAPCTDMEYYNNTLYACGQGYIYYLDTSDNKWKSLVDASSLDLDYLTKIKFISGKLYAVEYRSSAPNDATLICLSK